MLLIKHIREKLFVERIDASEEGDAEALCKIWFVFFLSRDYVVI